MDEATRHGALESERIARDVNHALSAIVEIARQHGGEVSTFAGDAAWLVWSAASEAELGESCLLAVQTAAAVLRGSAQWRLAGIPLRIRLSIGAGPAEYFEVGGIDGEWVGLILGGAVSDVAHADREGRPGTITISASAWSHLAGSCLGVPGPAGSYRLDRVLAPPPAVIRPEPQTRERMAMPAFVRQRVGETEGWNGEFRTCSVAFGRLDLDGKDPGAAQRLHAAIGSAQRLIRSSESTLYQVVADEKGIAIVALFGLPPQPHADDASRAIEYAFAVQRALAEQGLNSSFGVATGRLFLTIYGSEHRAEFAAVGAAVNRAARLADGAYHVAADKPTVQAAQVLNTIATRQVTPRILKGIADPVAVFEVYEKPRQTPSRHPAEPHSTLIGRGTERAVFKTALEALGQGSPGSILVEGEPGAGKSALVHSLLANAIADGSNAAVGEGDRIGQTTDYLPWRKVFRQLLGLADPLTTWPAEVLERLGRNSPYASLLGDLLGVDAGTDEAFHEFTEEGRANLTRNMLVELLASIAKEAPLLVVLEDVHWFDSLSLALLSDVLQSRLPVLVVATARPNEAAIADTQFAQVLPLQGLSLEETSDFLAAQCHAQSTGGAVALELQTVTSGNPLFLQELARFILEHQTLVLRDSVLEFSAEPKVTRLFEQHGVPVTLEGVIMGRLDALSAVARRVLRAAAVLGRTFSLADLHGVLAATDAADAGVQELLVAGVALRVPARETHDTYGFRHTLLMDVAYESISLADRRDLHARAAAWFAAMPGATSGALDPVLAHHLERAGDNDGAVFHLTRAGRSSLSSNANKEALEFFMRASTLLPRAMEASGTRSPAPKVEIEFGIGEAAQRLSRYAEARQHKEAALAELGGGIPNGPRLFLALLRETAVQMLRRWLPGLGASGPRSVEQQLRLSAETAELVEIYFYTGDELRSLFAALRSLNLAQGGGVSPQLARGLAIVGTIAGFARMPRVAQRYGERAMQVLSQVQDHAAAWWVPLVAGVSRLSAGDLTRAAGLMQMTASATEKIRDRRHWRDAIENLGIIAAMQGEWGIALDHLATFRATAIEDKDARYVVAALREQAYYLLQQGALDECERCLENLQVELDRGLTAELSASRQDLHAFSAAIAMRRGDAERAKAEAERALLESEGSAGGTSFPNMYWSQLLAARVFLGLLESPDGQGGEQTRLRGQLRRACRALDKHAAAHRVGAPAALLANGLRLRQEGRSGKAHRLLEKAHALAEQFGMPHERELAAAALTGQHPAIGSDLPSALPGEETSLWSS